MSDVNPEVKGSPRSRRMFGPFRIVAAAVFGALVLVALTAGGWAWHKRPSFCGSCHTPMKSYVEGYRSGDKTLMITQHASAKSALVCVDCHETKIGYDTVRGVRWATGDYVFPLKQREFGTRGFCLASGCHDEGEIIKATKDYGGAVSFNQHDPRHGKLQCSRCHTTHGKSVLMCNQCHKMKLPEGWAAPSPNGALAF